MIREFRHKRHVAKWGSKNRGYFQVFDKKIIEWQDRLIWLLNHPILKYWFRWVLRIHKDCEWNERIDKLLPNSYRIPLGNGKYKQDFRTHNKFSKRLYYAFRPLWWTLHAIDWLVQKTFYPEFSFGFDELTVYPDANPETNTVDGYCEYYDSTWSSVKGDGSNNTPNDSSSVGNLAYVWNGSTYGLSKGIFLFDTTSIPNNAVFPIAYGYVTQSKFSLTGPEWGISIADTPRYAKIYNQRQTVSNTAINSADYYEWYNTFYYTYSQMGDSLNYWKMDGTYNDFVIDSRDDILKKEAITKICAAVFESYESAPTGITLVYIHFADTSGTSQDPKLVVVYSLPEIEINGSLGANSEASGVLKKAVKINGLCETNSVLSSIPKTNAMLRFDCNAVSSVEAYKSVTKKILSNVDSVSNANSILRTQRRFITSIISVSSISPSLSAIYKLTSLLNGESLINTLLLGYAMLRGDVNSINTIIGSMESTKSISTNLSVLSNLDSLLKASRLIVCISTSTSDLNSVITANKNLSTEITSLSNKYLALSITKEITALLEAATIIVPNITAEKLLSTEIINKSEIDSVASLISKGLHSSIYPTTNVISKVIKTGKLLGEVTSSSNLIVRVIEDSGIKSIIESLSGFNSVPRSTKILISETGGDSVFISGLGRYFQLITSITITSNFATNVRSEKLIESNLTSESVFDGSLSRDREVVTNFVSSAEITSGINATKELVTEILVESELMSEFRKFTFISGTIESQTEITGTMPRPAHIQCNIISGSYLYVRILEVSGVGGEVNATSLILADSNVIRLLSAEIFGVIDSMVLLSRTRLLQLLLNSVGNCDSQISVDRMIHSGINPDSEFEATLKKDCSIKTSINASSEVSGDLRVSVQININGLVNAESGLTAEILNSRKLVGELSSNSDMFGLMNQIRLITGDVHTESVINPMLRNLRLITTVIENNSFIPDVFIRELSGVTAQFSAASNISNSVIAVKKLNTSLEIDSEVSGKLFSTKEISLNIHINSNVTSIALRKTVSLQTSISCNSEIAVSIRASKKIISLLWDLSYISGNLEKYQSMITRIDPRSNFIGDYEILRLITGDILGISDVAEIDFVIDKILQGEIDPKSELMSRIRSHVRFDEVIVNLPL